MIPKLEVARQRLLVSPLARVNARRAGAAVGQGVTFFGLPILDVMTGSTVEIGRGSTLVSLPRWTALGVSRPVILRTLTDAAVLRIGADCGLSGTTICAALHVSVGDRTLFGADVLIADTDFHPVHSFPRHEDPLPRPEAGDQVVIEEDVFIGARSIVLKGVRIGRGSVIGAGSIVTRSVPPGTIAAGNPARALGPLSPKRD